jgi:hypothetical protein
MYGAPWYFTILWRYHFIHFTSAAFSNFTQWPICVGMTEKSSDWTKLLDYLEGQNLKCKKGGSDCPGWDIEFAIQVLRFVFDQILLWYDFWKIDPKGQEARRQLIKATLNPTYVWKGLLLCLPFIWSSGHPYTNLVGGIANWAESRTNLGTLAEKQGYSHSEILSNVFSRVRFGFNGDDRVFSVDPVFTWYNQLTEREEYMRNFQRKPTPPEKHMEMGPYLSMDELQFNSRRWKEFNMGMYLAPLKIQTVLEMPLMTFDPTRRNVCQLLEACFRELFHHGKEVYDEWEPKISRAAKSVGIPLPRVTYESILQDWANTF